MASLIKKRAKVNATDNTGSTALTRAAENGNLAMVELLVANGAKIDMKDAKGENAIQWAGKRGHREIIRYLEEEQRKTRKAQRRADGR